MPRQSDTVMEFFNVPWDSGYRNIRYFASATERDAWFANNSSREQVMPHDTPTGASAVIKAAPAKVGKEYVVARNWDALNNFNYLRFKNRGYAEGDWTYCFIDNIRPGWEHQCFVSFTIDAWTNNIGHINFKNSFIERETGAAVNDLPEPVGINRYVYHKKEDVFASSKTLRYLFFATQSPDADPDDPMPEMSEIDGVVYPLYLEVLDTDMEIAALIAKYTEKGIGSAIMAVIAMPSNYVSKTTFGCKFNTGTFSVSRYTGGYTPKNKKCLRYPFMYCHIQDWFGNSQVFKFEDGDGDSVSGDLKGSISLTPSVTLNVNGGSSNLDGVQTMSHSCGTNVSYTVNGAAQWMAQNAGNLNLQSIQNYVTGASSAVSSGVSAIAGAITLNPMMLASSAISGAQTGANMALMDISQNTIINNAQFIPSSGSVPTGSMYGYLNNGRCGFVSHTVMPCSSELQALDRYFTRFGYTVNRIGKPAFSGSFYYFKTCGCTITGKFPQRDRDTLMAACDRGVTFWMSDDIGNYDL